MLRTAPSTDLCYMSVWLIVTVRSTKKGPENDIGLGEFLILCISVGVPTLCQALRRQSWTKHWPCSRGASILVKRVYWVCTVCPVLITPASVTTLLIPHNYLGSRSHKLSSFLWVKTLSCMEGLSKVLEAGGGGGGIWTELDWLWRTPPQLLNHTFCKWLPVCTAAAAREVWWGRYQTVGSWALTGI